MKKAVCWGIGGVGRHVYDIVKDTYDVLFFVDNDKSKYTEGGGGTRFSGPLA